MSIAADSQAPVLLTGHHLIIEGQEIPIEHRRMPLKDVLLDPDNPRIKHVVRRAAKDGKIGQAELRKLILEQPGVDDTFTSIRDNGGIQEAIYVRSDSRIIEGNCRAASYMKLHGIKQSDPRWQTIPAVMVPNITERQVAVLQGRYHVKGRIKWRAYEKIGHMHHMHTNLGMDAKAIALALGMKEPAVIRDLKAYEVMTEKLLPKMNGSGGLEKWSFVQELFKRKELAAYRAKPENIDEFVTMVVDKKLKQGTDVRKLEKVIKHASALKTLKKTGIDAAMTIVGKADPTADSKTFQKLKEATTILQHLQGQELERLKEDKPQQLLKELHTAIKAAAKAAGVKLQ